MNKIATTFRAETLLDERDYPDGIGNDQGFDPTVHTRHEQHTMPEGSTFLKGDAVQHVEKGRNPRRDSEHSNAAMLEWLLNGGLKDEESTGNC